MSEKIYDKDFLAIKEFANVSGFSVSTLRSYDRKGVLLPAMRGAGVRSSYRYYSPAQITTVKMIRVLSEMGASLGVIKELEQQRSPELLLKVLKRNKDSAAGGIRFYQDVYSVIDTYVSLLQEGISATETEIAVSEMPAKHIILGEENDYSDTVGFVREFTRFCGARHEPKLNTSFPVGGYWESIDAFLEGPSKPSRFFSLDPKGHEEKAGGLYLVGYTRGYYGQTNGLPGEMTSYAAKNGLEFCGPVYNLYLLDEISIADPSQYLLQVSAAVIETEHAPPLRPHRRF